MMDDVVKWAQHFGVEEHISTWNTEKGSKDSLIYWCLKEKKIDSAEYLKWAQSEYLLPALTEEFFQNTPPKDLWIRHTGLWPKGALPVAEWDGTLFVACLEPFGIEQPPQPFQLLLAPPDLLFHWEEACLSHPSLVLDEKIQSPEGLNFEQPLSKATPLPEGLDIPAPILESEIQNENTEVVDFPTGIIEKPIEDFGDIDFKTITEFKDERTPPPVKKSEITPMETTAYPNEIGDKTKVPNMLTDDEITQVRPSPLNANTKARPHAKSNANVSANASASANANANANVKSNIEKTKPTIQINPLAAEPQEMLKNSVPNKAEVTSHISDQEFTVTKSFVTNAAIVAIPNPTPAAPVPLKEIGIIGETKIDESFDPPTAEGIDTEEKIAHFALANMREFLSRTMILKLINGQLHIWAWDEKWKPIQGAQKLVSVKEPSPFRIVFETQTPYHGYLVENKITHQFFDHWNEGQMPDHMSIVPILDGDALLGMLLGITHALKANRSNIEDVESVAQKVSVLLKQSSALKNAA